MLRRTSLLRRHPAVAAVVACICLAGGARRAAGQIAPGQTLPSQVYFATLPGYFDGDYRASLAGFLAHSRGGIRTTNGQWIDSICYLAMAGECNYQLGQLPQALQNFDAALKLYVAYSDWMMRVQFPPAIVAAAPGVSAFRPGAKAVAVPTSASFPKHS